MGTNVSIWKVELLAYSGPYCWLVCYVAFPSSTAQRASLAFLTILTIQGVGNLDLPFLWDNSLQSRIGDTKLPGTTDWQSWTPCWFWEDAIFAQTENVSVTVIHCMMCKGEVQNGGNFFIWIFLPEIHWNLELFTWLTEQLHFEISNCLKLRGI
jgi:hypothetical protein